jgi:AraC family transcriptional regulator
MGQTRVAKSSESATDADAVLGAGEAGLRVVRVDVAAGAFDEHPNPQDKIAVVLRADGLDVAWHDAGGRRAQACVSAGTSSLMPRDMPYRTCWHRAGEMALVSLSPDLVRAREEIAGRLELAPAWSRFDPFILELTRTVLRIQDAGLATRLFLDAAAEVLLTHLATEVSSSTPARMDGLARGAQAVERAMAYIEAHIGDDLDVGALAAVAGTPRHGFARAFRAATGTSPHRYVMLRRCERARDLIIAGRRPLADIAADCGFASQAHMTTLFGRMLGLSPGRLRRENSR